MNERNPFGVTRNSTVRNVDLDKKVVYLNDGRRLTEALAEQIAQETLEESRELRRQQREANLVPGRKSLSRDGSTSPTVQFRVPTLEYEQLIATTKMLHVSVSNYARKALEDALERDRDAAAGAGG